MISISNDHVIEIHYTLTLENGEIVDSTDGLRPLAYIHGKKNIMPGLEKALTGKKSGDVFKAIVPPEEGYGPKNPDLIHSITKDKFRNEEDIQIGSQFKVPNENGQMMMLQIVAIDGDQVTLDANHPLAGVNLHFNISVESVRPATDEELAHGHLHKGAGCCGGDSGGCGKSCGEDDHC